MTTINCERCGKEFNGKSRYTQHQKRKTPCFVESKLQDVPILTQAPTTEPEPGPKIISIETVNFNEL